MIYIVDIYLVDGIIDMGWEVRYSGKAKKALKKKSKLTTQNVRDIIEALHLDLEEEGPVQNSWPNYSKLKGQKKGVDKRHCHLIKGNPTYVACWEVIDQENKILEVYYVGTHEKAPY